MATFVMCRLCAKPQTQSLQKLFDGKHTKILKQFQKLTGKTLDYEEDLPQHICQCCVDDLKKAYEFRVKMLTVQYYYTTPHYLDKLKLARQSLAIKSDVEKTIEDQDGENSQSTKSFEEVEEFQFEEENNEQMDDEETQNIYDELVEMEEARYGAIKGVCHYCGKTCKSQSILERHLNGHEGIRPFACEFCDHKSFTPLTLKQHRMIHTGERPFECKYCDKRFISKETKKRHMRIHENVRPFACQYCDMKFSMRSILKNHLFSHTGESDFNCETCKKVFRNNTSLQQHFESNVHLKKVAIQEESKQQESLANAE